MIRHARELAGELGVSGRASHAAGDFVALAETIPRSDIVILDKVVCCYDDLPRLLDASLDRAGRVYALSYPRGVTRWGFAVLVLLGRVLGWSFVPRWHDWEAMLRRIRRDNFDARYARDSLFWSVRVFERSSLPLPLAPRRER